MARCSGGMAATSARRPPRKAAPKPAPAEDRPGQVERAGVGRGGGDDHDHSGGEGDRAGAGGDPGGGACGQELGDRRRCGERDDAAARDDRVGRVEQVPGELRAEREEEGADRPGGEDGESGEEEGAADDGRDARAGDGEPEARALEHRLRHPVRARQGDRDEGEQDEVRQEARFPADLDERRRDEDPEPDADGRGGRVGEPDAGRIAARMQVEQRRAGRAQRCAGGEPLDAAGNEEPGGGVGEEEEEARRHQPSECGEQDGPAADAVGDAAGEQQAREHPEGVGRVDQGQRQRREVPEHAVGAVERRRRDRGEQPEADHARGERVRGPVRQRAPPLRRLRDRVQRRPCAGEDLRSLHLGPPSELLHETHERA